MKKKFTQRQLRNANPSFGTLDKGMARAEVPKHIVVIETEGKSIEQIVEEMMRVPMDKHMLLDAFIGRKPGDPFANADQEDLYRLQMLLNSEFNGERFNYLGDDMIAQMVRRSVAEELWFPQLRTAK